MYARGEILINGENMEYLDPVTNEKYIPLTFNNENNSYSIDIDDLSKSEGILTYSNGEPIVCEVNSNAFFDGIEMISGVNVAKAYAEYIIKTLHK